MWQSRINNKIIIGQWDIALRDLEYALGLDFDGNGEITWIELRTRYQEIKKYAFSSLQINNDAGSRYFCESLFWASQPKQAAKT